MTRRKHFRQSDPTANTAVKRADRAAEAARQRPRKLVQEFPEVFDGLLPHEIRAVAFDALSLARNNVWAITREHLEQAREGRKPRRA